jgi:hypothetical protein
MVMSRSSVSVGVNDTNARLELDRDQMRGAIAGCSEQVSMLESHTLTVANPLRSPRKAWPIRPSEKK